MYFDFLNYPISDCKYLFIRIYARIKEKVNIYISNFISDPEGMIAI